MVDLPQRVDEIHHLEFSHEERNAYSAANRETIALFEEAISSGRQNGKTFNALARLNFLRVFCNLGLLANGRAETSSTKKSWTRMLDPGAEDNSFYGDLLDGTVACAQCGQTLIEDLLEGLLTPNSDLSPSTVRNPSVCDNCRFETAYLKPNLTQFLPSETFNASPTSSAPSTPSDRNLTTSAMEPVPTKVKALMTDLLKHCSHAKR